MKKKIIYISISILLILTIILNINSTPKEEVYIDKNNTEEINNKSIAIYLENENGDYNKTTSFPNKEDNYVLNTTKSICDGSANINWNNEAWGLELSNISLEETNCSLYFDRSLTKEVLLKLNIANVKDSATTFTSIATTDEGVFKVEDGMYGGYSYYWRGAVTNNYVKFAGFCWRIVRINGDGSIRLIYDGSTCHANGISTTDSIALISQMYNANANNSSYVGWTYNIGSQHTTTGTSSNAKTQLESWYSNNLVSYTDKIADGKYCNDRNVQSGSTWSATGSTYSYAPFSRLNSKIATLSCPSEDIYILKVGLITSDEATFAGGNGTNNSAYYLYNNQGYWTMSPYNWYSGNSTAHMLCITATGSLNHDSNVNNTWGLRPVINLKADTIFTMDGTGTQTNPYVVQ